MGGPLDTVLAKLEGVRRVSGGWEARCPAHDDKNPSLSVGEGEDGRVLLKCHAGCETTAICEALGMRTRDLFPRAERQERRLVATYNYPDADGRLLFQVLRYDPKTFRQRRPDGAGGWIWGLRAGEYARSRDGDWYAVNDRTPPGAERRHFEATEPVLYSLPQLLAGLEAGEVIWIAEGEKDVLALRAAGAVATCNPQGAGKWRSAYSRLLRGADVVIVADRDENGREHARQVAASLAGTARSVRIVEAAAGKDAADHLAAGYGLDDFVPLVLESTEKRREPPVPPAADGGTETASARPYHLTDLGNAERFVDHHATFVRHISNRGWVIYGEDGRFVDDPAAIRRLAIATVRSIYGEAERVQDNDERRKAIAMHAKASESANRIEAMLQLAAHFEEVQASTEQMDADPMLLNAPNGVIDLRTGDLRPHEPGLLMTKCTGAPYEPAADCPLWRAHLELVFDGRSDLIDFFQVLCGYAATGLTIEQKLAILYGSGANGKSVTVETLRAALGEYARSADFGTFVVRQRGDSPRDDLARLVGVRLVTASEGPDGARLDEAMVKQATGGEPIVCRALYKGTFEYQPQFQILLSTNHKPRIHGGDHAIWRRVLLVPFDVRIPDERKDERMPQKLRAELPGVLAWIVDGARRWHEEGLHVPDDVTAATNAYREEQDVLADFLAAECIIDETLSTTVGALHRAYDEWAQREGERNVSPRTFRNMLLERGFRDLGQDRVTRRRMVGGLALRDEASQTAFSGDE